MIHKIEKKKFIGINDYGYENKVKYPIYVSNTWGEDKHADVLLIGEGEKKDHVLIKDFNTFMDDHTLHRESKIQMNLRITNTKNMLVCIDDKFSKPFKPYVDKDSVYNFINSLIEDSKCCSDVMKKQFNKEQNL